MIILYEIFIYLNFYLFIFFFVGNAALLLFSLLLIGIFLLRPYESIETSDSY